MSSNSPLATTAGIASRNENRAAAGRCRPSSSPALIVAPDRDTPGISASDCARPISTPSRVESCSSVALVAADGGRRSRGSRPKTISVVPISHRSRPPVSIWSWNAKPRIPIGIVATIRYQPIRTSGCDRSDGSRSARSHFVAIDHSSWRKKISTAASVPSWVIAVNAAPGILPAEERGDDALVRTGGDRQELGQSLHDPSTIA